MVVVFRVFAQVNTQAITLKKHVILLQAPVRLSVIACVPIIASAITGFNMHFGGTSLLIVTGVTLSVVESLNSQLVVRHHEGFLS